MADVFPVATSGTPVRWEDRPGGHAACDAEITRLKERIAFLGAEHARHSLAVSAHQGRADQQESRAVHAEKQVSRLAWCIERYDELAEQSAQGQRDSDVLKEIRRRIPPLERQAERGRVAEGNLTAITSDLRQLAEGCQELGADPDLDRHCSASAAYRAVAKDILAIISGEKETGHA